MRRITAYLIMVITMVFLWSSDARADIYGLADWSTRTTNTNASGQSTTSTMLTQGYTLGGTKIVTSVISLSGDVMYTITDTNGDRKESIYPTLTLNYSPRSMYNFSLGYTRTETAPSEGIRLSNSNLRAAFAVRPDYLPSLMLSFNRSTSQDYDSPHKIDNGSTRFGLSTGYTFNLLNTETKLLYTFSDTMSEDTISAVKTESPAHSATVDFSRTFWDKRITTNLNAGYGVSEMITTSLGALSRFEQTLAASRGLFSINIMPINGLLDDRPGLIDADRQVAVQGIGSNLIDLKNSGNNIGLQLPAAQGVHRIDLYIKTSDAGVSTYNFGWQLYTSDDSVNWTALSSTVTYDPYYSRFQFAFPEKISQYFKVVNTFPSVGITVINITEMEAIGYLLETPTQTVTSTATKNSGGYKLTINPVQRLHIDYGVTYYRILQSLDGSEGRSVNQDLALNLRLYSSQHLTVTSGFSVSKIDSSKDAPGKPSKVTDSGSDNTSLVFALSPLPTLNANLSYNHVDTLNNREIINIFDGIATSVSMKVYEGVDATVGASVSKSKQPVSDLIADTLAQSVKINLSPRSDLSIGFNANRSTGTSVSKGEQTTSTGKSSDANVSYSPTRKLFLSANYTLEPIPLQGYAVAWLPTRNIQASANWSISQDATSKGATINWLPLPNLTIFVTYGLSESDGATHLRSDSLFAKASLRF